MLKASEEILRDPEMALTFEACSRSTLATAKVFFPDLFYREFSKNHEAAMEFLDDDSIQLGGIIAHREFGKSSLTQVAYEARNILFQLRNFIVTISCSATQAIMHSDNLRTELTTNDIIKKWFGDIKSETFRKDFWKTNTGITVLPRGQGQKVRGIIEQGNRPDLIILDDLEDDESVLNPDTRMKLKRWFFASVLGAVASAGREMDTGWKILFCGTILHEDSLLMNLFEDPAWSFLKLPLCSPTYVSNWPEFKTDEECKKLADTLGNQGLHDVFAREYLCEPVSAEHAIFKPEFFQYYEQGAEELKDSNIENVVIVDPAKTLKDRSDDTAIVGISVNMENHKIYVRDVVSGQLTPDEQYEEAIAMCSRIGAFTLGVEVTALNEFITQPLLNEIIRRKLPLNVVELTPRANKPERIGSLVPYYRMGFVYHLKECCTALEGQLVAFPRSAKDDIMDALAYIVQMLSIGDKFFQPIDDDESFTHHTFATVGTSETFERAMII